MEQNNNADIGFGGQNQIVNEQEQNKEVNGGGLTATDSEESLEGKPEEKKPEPEKTKPDIVATDKDDDNDAEDLTDDQESARKKRQLTFDN